MAANADIILSVEGLQKKYGAVQALRGVDFKIRRGEVCGLIGPNGSGKSTLFDCCTGLQRSDAGNVVMNGHDITNWSMNRIAREAKLVRSFQKTVVFHSLNTEENLVLAGQMSAFPGLLSTFSLGPAARRRLRRLRERAAELIEISGLQRVAQLPCGNLSGGQQKLVQFASMLMPEPELIMLDEPLAGINPVLIDKVIESIREANRRMGVTFVVIEHNTDVLMDLSQRVIVLHQGAKLADGDPESVIQDSRVVEAYLGV
ncbi:ABC transporter ATP-binding protein [Burkholderia multivorans]|uniref:ABC transporter ATP-binding protein n=2 Tax=Burkholderia multivorans TaxID=87883 RepID=UPI0021C0BC17|nr:ABC transporter ATP-binding protein [Burkholderia multivorans]MDR8763736.1 Lipopolysaccharide export system ATP-binding protein LptB [Burkholderia multivorans]MDR8766198.1 Lipopolysaccharide export system ATP-binding protein LptB [Burkholderia multivorans]MDR8789733.1 Lipopolysaccharide export system ATP-binding protein LptB [Burkholderia multivorans]MDR8794569.1 Lipopolysaccharide export system ATP-binding protein LptB [Burkholderia multivorans]MDR8799857.1 Lipopolysaccharide export system